MMTNLLFGQASALGKRLAMVLTMLLIVGIGQAWGETATYTLNSSNNGGSVTTGNVSWSIASGAITVQNSNCKLTGTITVTLPAGATLNKVSIAKSNTWGNGATVTFKTGSTTLNTFSNSGDYTLTTNKDKLTYTFSKSGTSSKNAWVKSITVDYTVAAATTYKVTYDKNGATSGTVPTDATSYNNGATVTVKPNSGTLAKTGYTFGGWNTKADGTGTNYTAGSGTFKITGNTTLYAKWNLAAKYTVTLNAGSGTCAASVTETSAGAGVTLPTPTLSSACQSEGWSFAGWAISPVEEEITDSPKFITDNPYKPSGDITLYAVYQRTETTNGGGNSVSESITIVPNTFPDKGTSSYASGAERIGAVNEISLGGHYITGNQNNTPTNSTAGTYLQCQAKNATIYNKTKLPGNITKVVINQYDAKAFSLYCGSEQLMASNNTSTEQTPSGTKINDVTAATKMTWDVSGNYTYFALKKGNNTGYVTSIVITYQTDGGQSETTYYHSTPDCGITQTSQLAKPTNLQVTNITSTSATLSWGDVTNASGYEITVVAGDSYNETISVEENTTSITLDNLTQLTAYSWTVIAIGDGTNYTNSESATSEFSTPKACTDAVNVKKGTPSNGSFTMVSGYQSTCNGPVTVTLSDIEPATGYQFSAITQSGVDAAKVTIDNTAKTVTYAQNTTGTSTINVSFTPAVYTINYKDQGAVAFSGTHAVGHPTTHTYNTATTLQSASKDHYTFGGWYKESDCSGTEVTTLGATDYTNNITLYAKWTAKTYTITLDANGGTFVDNRDSQTKGSATFDYIYGTYATYSDAPNLTEYYSDLKRDGYQFDKWVSAGSPWNKLFTSTGDRTIQAQWKKLYSITLSENGTTKELDAQTSTSYTLPTELTAGGSCQDDTKELVGWSTVAIPTPGDKPDSKFYELGAKVTLTEDQTTFYAVFATVEGSQNVFKRMQTLDELNNASKIAIINAYSSSAYILNTSLTASAKAPEESSSKITVTEGQYWTLEKSNSYWKFKNSDNKYLTTNTIPTSSSKSGSVQLATSGNNEWAIAENTYTNNGTPVFTICNASSKNAGLEYNNGWILYYSTDFNTSWFTLKLYIPDVSYSDYTTTCVKLPDPVLSFATEPANPIEFTDAVCGGNSSKQSVTVVGENLRDVVNVSVTGPYKIARTSSTALKDFTTSLTLDKTAAGAIHSNYQTVYIISTPPAQSTEATTGTLTFTTTKGNTLTVNLSTPTVTCTQYTLTLVDRGVSTEQPTKYYAGEKINEAPADPEGVCTDPIHYVFDGWAAATVAEGSTTYTKVNFPYTVKGNTKFYAVYRYLEGGGDGDYHLVEKALDDWSGDYLIAYSNTIFADGRIGGKEDGAIGYQNVMVDLSDKISLKTIPAADGDTYKVTLEAVIGGYVLKTQDGKYNYHTNNTGNDISASDKNTADKYPITVKFVSAEEINLCLGGGAIGSVFRYNAQGYFRFYKNGGQQPVYLYKKADGTTYYTTSPVCGPHLAITEGKEIYVTGGNAGGTRDLVIAQQKVSYKATRLNVGPTSQVPDVKVATNGITVGGVVTSDVKVTIDQTKEQQTDGTYTITGTITVQYQPSAKYKQEDIQVQLAVDYNTDAKDNFTVHARSLPAEFVIVAKSGDKWYALNGDMNNGTSANPANGQVTLDDNANPTKATYAPCNTIYTFDGVPNTGDRTRVRFQGTDGAWLWAASGTNVGIQNKSLKETPEGNNKAYNWKLETEDNITYKFHNDNNSRLLGLNGEKFGMYASGVQDIRILPYEAKCLYNYAPTNLKVSVLKGTYVTLTWDAVAGATKYQYSTNGTTWTDAGTEPTATINGLEGNTKYTYYIRAYHEDAGVSQECIDYAEITFTTANCDDVPADITYTADLNSITVSWTAAAPTATIKLYLDENGEHAIFTQSGTTSPWKISTLSKNTTYYLQIFSDGTCASPIVPVKTEDVEVDIVEWQPQGIIVDINTDETVGVTLENEVSFGSGLGTEATELFFSKYYEASYNVKLVAIYNGTKNIIDLTDYTIQYGITSWESNYITLKDFGATKGQIQPGEEIILYSMQDNSEDDDIMDCVHEDFPDGNWVRVTSSNNEGKGTLSFGGDKTIILCKTEYDDEADEYYDNLIDVIGALKEDPKEGILPTNENTEKPSWGDKKGWVCETGLSIADDSQIGISTNRCLLVRNNTVTSGLDAVAQNIEGDFVTLCSEWKGAQVPDDAIDNGVAASCENFAYVGTFDYSDYYTKYVPMGDEQVFDANARNADGTVTIPITDLYKHACSNIRVKLSNKNGEVLSDREYKVPIMITTTQGTDGQTFLDLQQNLATKEVDGGGNVIATHPLSLAEVREICKTCDVVIRDNATLTKVTDGTTNDHPQVHDVIVYEGASIVIPDGNNHNYTINSLSLRRKGDNVASAQVQGTGKLVLPADVPVTLNMRIDANNWHWFTLPYDCDIEDVTWSDGTPAKYNTDWFLMYYDGESRAASTNPHDNHWKVYNEKTIEAGKGYIIGITGDLAHPNYTFELRFPMEQDVLTAEQTNKTVALNAWGVQSDNTPNNKGWNLVGNPYLNYYKTADEYSYEGLPLLQYTGIDPETGDRLYDDNGNIPFLVTPIDGGWYEYQQELASDVQMMPFTAYFVQVGDPANPDHTDGKELNASFEASNRGKKSILRRAQSEVDELEEPAIVVVSLTNAKGESDKTTLLIADRFTSEYEMNADFFKWFGDYYTYYTKPVLYTLGADQGKRAFNALNEELATQPVALGMYAAQAGDYTFTLNQKYDLSRVEEVWLYDATENVYTNLMQQDYTFSTTKVNGEGRFSLSVKMMPELSTEIENIKQGNIWATTRNNEIVVNGLSKGMQLWIYDATGKLLHSDRTTNYQHSYGIPQTGAYFIRVHNNNEAQTIAVVVE